MERKLKVGDPDFPVTPALRARLQATDRLTSAAPIPPRPEATLSRPILAAGAITLGVDERKNAFGIYLDKLLDGRLLIQGNSGAGKSWTLRKLLEESHSQVQQIILDPEGEFLTLAEMFGHTVVEAHRLDIARTVVLAERIREQRLSTVIDLSQLDRDRQMIAVAHFINGLIETPRELWHPAIVAIDEAHLFAPYGVHGHENAPGRKASIAALVDLMSRGRKRGLAGVLATARFARLSKSVSSEALNFMIGVNTLDLDIRRAAETIGWDARRAFDRLPMLETGNFVAVGPSFPGSPVIATVGQVRSRHLGSTPAMTPPPATGDGAELLDIEGLAREAQEAADDDRRLPIGARSVRDLIRDPAFPLAGRIYGELTPLYPEGTTVASLAKHLKASPEAANDAVALLLKWAAIEILGDSGPAMALRIARNMRTGS